MGLMVRAYIGLGPAIFGQLLINLSIPLSIVISKRYSAISLKGMYVIWLDKVMLVQRS